MKFLIFLCIIAAAILIRTTEGSPATLCVNFYCGRGGPRCHTTSTLEIRSRYKGSIDQWQPIGSIDQWQPIGANVCSQDGVYCLRRTEGSGFYLTYGRVERYISLSKISKTTHCGRQFLEFWLDL
ncbi:hypothetical protein Bhyg_06306, partial [Pseudolycoriella hygida]